MRRDFAGAAHNGVGIDDGKHTGHSRYFSGIIGYFINLFLEVKSSF
jgi:hypothetical protein